MSRERVERRLAAILAADVAGYARLMGEDEEGTLAALKAIRRDLADPAIAEHHGRIVKTTGDGLLVEFASVVDAVRCAVAWQRAMAERNGDVPEERRIEFRIGINLGDIISDDNDIYGDGVNVAARLEALADPGGISVSRVVRDQVHRKLDFAFDDRGEQQLKNIAEPVHTYHIQTSPADAAPIADSRSGVPSAASGRKKSTPINHYSKMRQSLIFFDRRFTETFPGKREIFVVSDSAKACAYILRLLRAPLSASEGKSVTNPIWWWRGLQNMHIQKARRLGPTTLLMDCYELDIDYLIAFPHSSYKHRFVYVQAKGVNPTGLYEDTDERIRRSKGICSPY